MCKEDDCDSTEPCVRIALDSVVRLVTSLRAGQGKASLNLCTERPPTGVMIPDAV